MNILTQLPANYSTLHQPFQTWTLRIISQVHIVANFGINPMAGYVITGDLMVIENVKLRELVSKGPKYREPN